MIKEENVPKISINICFLELLDEFARDSKTTSNWPWYTSHRVFKSLKFGCMYVCIFVCMYVCVRVCVCVV